VIIVPDVDGTIVVNVQMECNAASLQGRVVNADGGGTQANVVILSSTTGEVILAKADENGNFTARDLAPGEPSRRKLLATRQ
jgi:hypothetical protein